MLTGKLPFEGELEQTVLYKIVNKKPKHPRTVSTQIPLRLDQIILKCLDKNANSRYHSAEMLFQDLLEYRHNPRTATIKAVYIKSLGKHATRLKLAGLILLFIIFIAAMIYHKIDFNRKVKWARKVALPEIERLVMEEGEVLAPYSIAIEANQYIPENQFLQELLHRITQSISFQSEPADADVYYKPYNNPDNEWEFFGQTPISDVRIPMVKHRWKIEKDGYVTKETATIRGEVHTRDKEIKVVLEKSGSVPPGMVRIKGGTIEGVEFGDFFADKYEITNEQYQEFVDNGGYEKQEYWKQDFIKDGRQITWEQAMKEFVDEEGMPGPAGWMFGHYPAGQANFPVTGISWYEAVAYAEFVRKDLPTLYHWRQLAISAPDIVPVSNLDGLQMAPVGEFQGMAHFGTYDVAGNAEEWTWNKTSRFHLICGGSWDSPKYDYENDAGCLPMTRLPTVGFRCVKYLPEFPVTKEALAEIPPGSSTDYSRAQPCSDEIFKRLKDFYKYEKTELDARIENIDSTSHYFIRQKISFNAAYDSDRVIVYLYLPKFNDTAPYQTVIFCPGSYAFSTNLIDNYGTMLNEFMTKLGRAFLFPVYFGTFERGGGGEDSYENINDRDLTIKVVKDMCRSIDYLETREDINASKIGYVGLSYGGVMGAIIPAIEKRFKASVLYGGIFYPWWTENVPPEINQINFISRVTVPTLILNGNYDDGNQQPFYNLLGTPDENKQLVIIESGHAIPRSVRFKYTNEWLNKYLGPVK